MLDTLIIYAINTGKCYPPLPQQYLLTLMCP